MCAKFHFISIFFIFFFPSQKKKKKKKNRQPNVDYGRWSNRPPVPVRLLDVLEHARSLEWTIHSMVLGPLNSNKSSKFRVNEWE